MDPETASPSDRNFRSALYGKGRIRGEKAWLMDPHSPLETLGLLGIARERITDSDRAWLKASLGSEAAAFDSVDEPERGLLVAWRRPGSAPESARLAASTSGARHVLVAGRSEYPSRSVDQMANVLEHEGDAALRSTSGPCVVMTWSEGDPGHRFFRPQSGQRLLFYAELGDGLLFASDARTLVDHPEVDASTHWDSVADHMAFGHIYGDKTLFRGVQRLGAGEELLVSGGRLRRESVLVPAVPQDESRAESVDRIDAALHEAVEEAWSGVEKPALCLSAGLDSRTLMAVAHRQGIPLVCVTNGIEGSIELRLTRRMCQALGATHLSCLLEEGVVEGILDGVDQVVNFTDGEGTIQSANMLYLTRKYRSELGLERVIRGVGGELLKLSVAYAYSVPPDLAQSPDAPTVRQHLFNQLTLTRSAAEDQSIRGLLGESLSTVPEQSFQSEWDSLDPLDPSASERVSQLFLRCYLARAGADSMRILRQSVDLSQPFLDERFLQTLGSTPMELRLDPSLQIELIRRNCPALLRIPNSNLRARLDAGRARRWLALQTQRVARRLGLGEIDVPEKWLTARLDDFYRDTLLEERSLSRPHIDADGMRRLLSQSAAARSASSSFLGRLATFELSLRRFQDPVQGE